MIMQIELKSFNVFDINATNVQSEMKYITKYEIYEIFNKNKISCVKCSLNNFIKIE